MIKNIPTTKIKLKEKASKSSPVITLVTSRNQKYLFLPSFSAK